PIAQRMPAAAEDLAVKILFADIVRLDIERGLLHPRHHFLGLGKRTGGIVHAMNHNDLRSGTEMFHRFQMPGIAEKAKLLVIEREKVRAPGVARVARVEFTPLEVEGDGIA